MRMFLSSEMEKSKLRIRMNTIDTFANEKTVLIVMNIMKISHWLEN